MKIAGIIAEYNPFHNGHEYHIKRTREVADAVITVMSGNFVQRAEPSVMSKFARAEAAVKCGADIVFELPVCWSMASAQKFAMGGVSLLDALGCVDYLSFGSECADTEKMMAIAQMLESKEVSEYIKNNLDSGETFAVIRQNAIKEFLGGEYSVLLGTPNNILGIEYCKELLRRKSKIIPFTVERLYSQHDSDTSVNGFTSASLIRGLIRNSEDFKNFVPDESFSVIQKELEKGGGPVDVAFLERSIILSLRNANPSDLRSCPDVSEGIENRITESAKSCNTLEELYQKVKTKRYTHSRIRRIVLSYYLGISEIPDSVPYARLLAFSEKGAEVLKMIKKTSSIPIVTKKSDFDRLSDIGKYVFDTERRAFEAFSMMTPIAGGFGAEFKNMIYKKLG